MTEGTAVVTVTTEDSNKTASCIISVTTNIVSVTGVTMSHNNRTLSHDETLPLTVGATLSLVPTVIPANATNKNISWNSSVPGVATVDNGIVNGVSAGTETITVTTQDGSKKATCTCTCTVPSNKPAQIRFQYIYSSVSNVRVVTTMRVKDGNGNILASWTTFNGISAYYEVRAGQHYLEYYQSYGILYGWENFGAYTLNAGYKYTFQIDDNYSGSGRGILINDGAH